VNKRLCCIGTCNGFVQLIFTPSVGDDVRAFLQEAARRGRADTGSCPRYNYYLSFESIHDLLRLVSQWIRTTST
jgi:hypothetical protein